MPTVRLSHHQAYGSRTWRFVKQNATLFTPLHLSATFKIRLHKGSFPQYLLDLLHKCLMVSHPLDVSLMCHLIRPEQPLYPVPVQPALNLIGGWNQGLQSRFLHSLPHGKRACDLLMLRITNPRTRVFHPLE